MVLWPLLLLPLPVLSALPKHHGVSPHLVEKYVESPSGMWTCLDGSKQIAWVAVNDDYCDCPDGSDEPGTSACPNSTFYCRNEGHIGGTLKSSRVNDGLCEPECCDGSDELPGVCPNRCKEVGEAHKTRLQEELKIRRTGSKIRSSYIAFAQKEKKRLQDEIAKSAEEVAMREKEVARLKELMDASESLSAAALAHRQQSPLYQSLVTHSKALKSLQIEYKKHLEREKALGDILESLKNGYNPNYQDMAVLEAVRGWEQLSTSATVEESELGQDEDEPPVEEGMWSAKDLESRKLDQLLKTDYSSLLFEHDQHVATPTPGSMLFDITAYIPDFLVPHFQTLREEVQTWLSTVGLTTSAPTDARTANSQARKAWEDADHSLRLTREEFAKAETDLQDLFDPEGFGVQGEWKKLDGTCLTTPSGGYNYEVCFFNEAHQKPGSNGGQTFKLGKFQGWNPDPNVKVGSPEYYSKQVYANGAKCWNGPSRSVTLILSCGTENLIHTVTEPEKCEYHIQGTTPALCLAPSAEEEKLAKRDEL